ncbi:MAG TPA: CotH kinase family protein, partial [Bacteroidia bacterium]|nr:CotH kinase family protein [Bacteroidia bacterium]
AESDNVYLDESELNAIYRLEITQERIKTEYPNLTSGQVRRKYESLLVVRDRFLVGAYTGLRVSDFSRIGEMNIDENYIQLRYNNNWGNLYKCLYPADLENLGTNANAYKLTAQGRRVYELKTNTVQDNYTDLKNFVQALHAPATTNYQYNLEKQFNVNSFLRTYAFDVITGNWDNYAGNTNNYYLYNDWQTGKINYLPYDVDNTYGIDWLGKDWGTRNVYNWPVNSANKYLITKLMAYPDYANRFTFYLNQIVAGAGSFAFQQTFIDNIKTQIETYVINDTYYTLDYGYTFGDFINSYTQAIGGHVDYGLKPYISTRNAQAVSQMQVNQVAPIISEKRHYPFRPVAGDTVFIKALVEDELTVVNPVLNYRYGQTATWLTTNMFDDGLHNDDASGDNIFGVALNPVSTKDTLYYYITCTDANNLTGREPRLYSDTLIIETPWAVSINEFMADNANVIADNYGEYDDWIELYNAGTTIVNQQLFLTDDFLKPDKWRITTPIANGFQIFWADDDEQQGSNHASFKLNATADKIAITEYTGKDFRFIDSLSYGVQTTNVSMGCYPDGAKPIVTLASVTPMFSNVVAATFYNEFKTIVHPNPVNNILYINASTPLSSLQVFDVTGRVLLEQKIQQSLHLIQLDVTNLPQGNYFIRLVGANGLANVKFCKQL